MPGRGEYDVEFAATLAGVARGLLDERGLAIHWVTAAIRPALDGGRYVSGPVRRRPSAPHRATP